MTLTRAFRWSGGSESLTIQGATENRKKEAKTSSTGHLCETSCYKGEQRNGAGARGSKLEEM